MERPSHMIFRYQTVSNRLSWAGLSLLLPAGMFWLFANGLTASVIGTVLPPDLTIDFKQDAPKKPPPPEPNIPKRIELPKTQVPVIDVPREIGGTQITTLVPQPGTVTPQPVLPDRAPVSIAATHTTPPYPLIARRVGWEAA